MTFLLVSLSPPPAPLTILPSSSPIVELIPIISLDVTSGSSAAATGKEGKGGGGDLEAEAHTNIGAYKYR